MFPRRFLSFPVACAALVAAAAWACSTSPQPGASDASADAGQAAAGADAARALDAGRVASEDAGHVQDAAAAASADAAGPTDAGSSTDAGAWADAGAATDGGFPVFWSVNNVSLQADSVRITAGGATFVGVDPLYYSVDGDPGDSTYSTLEVTWQENGVEMRFNMYFAADATDWWCMEIRTYNGLASPDWIEYHGTSGNLFKTKLGQVYSGDVDLTSDPGQPIAGTIHLPNMRLVAFK